MLIIILLATIFEILTLLNQEMLSKDIYIGLMAITYIDTKDIAK